MISPSELDSAAGPGEIVGDGLAADAGGRVSDTLDGVLAEHPEAKSGKPAPPSRRHLRGFAVMDKDRLREVASQGGKKAHAIGTAHEWTPAEARTNGLVGGAVIGQNKAHMQRIGRLGAKTKLARAAKKAERVEP